MTVKSNLLARWLDTLENCQNARMVTVKIGRTTYTGAVYEYRQVDGVVDTRYYVLGERPASDKRGYIAYRAAQHGESDLFVATSASAEIVADERYATAHPFGVYFALHIWPGKNDDGLGIDAFAKNRWKRMTISIEFQSSALEIILADKRKGTDFECYVAERIIDMLDYDLDEDYRAALFALTPGQAAAFFELVGIMHGVHPVYYAVRKIRGLIVKE